MSERNEGASIAEVTGKYLGPVMQNIMRVFSVVLLIMVGTVFAVGPAGLIVTLCKNSGMSGVLTTTLFWLIIILVYYFIATFISIDAIIGKIYPVFGICLIIMAVGVIFGIFTNPAYTIPELWDHFGSMHPSGTPDLELHVHHRRLRRYFRLPLHPVASDGALHEEREAGATSSSTVLWSVRASLL